MSDKIEFSNKENDNVDISNEPSSSFLTQYEQSKEKSSCGCSENITKGINKNPSYIYALGKLDFAFPNRSIEMEYKQVIEIMNKSKNQKTDGLSDTQIAHRIFNDPDYHYIANHVCWILRIEEVETYILLPRYPYLMERIVKSYSEQPALEDINLIIGTRGPLSDPTMCNGLILPIVYLDQIYSFDRPSLIESIPKTKKSNTNNFKKSSTDLFNYIIQIADNAGAIDEHRALNYLSVRYDKIYHKANEMQENNFSLISIDVRQSRLTGIRKILDVIFSFQHRVDGIVEKQFIRVDVTEKFPFRITPLQEYFDR